MTTPTGSYVLVAKNIDDKRIEKSFCRINTIKKGQDGNKEPTREQLCLVKRVSRAKIFDSLEQAMYWLKNRHLHSGVMNHCDIQVKELLI